MAPCFRFATFSSLAGVDPSDDPGEGVPPSDSLDLWPVLAGTNGTSPRTSAALTAATLVVGESGTNGKFTFDSALAPGTTLYVALSAGDDVNNFSGR